MRGTDETRGSLFSYVDLEERIPARRHHLARHLRAQQPVAVLGEHGRHPHRIVDPQPDKPPKHQVVIHLLHQLPLGPDREQDLQQARPDQPLGRDRGSTEIGVKRLELGVETGERVIHHLTDLAQRMPILAHREVAPLLSDDHFSVDGTLVKAWASMKSFQPKADDTPPDDDPGDPPGPDATAEDLTEATEAETAPMPRPTRQSRNTEVDFRGERRSNATHASTTDPDARLYKKSPGTGAMLCFIGHALMENRAGLIVQGDLTQADGHAERRAAMDMIHRHSPGSTRQLTLGADKGFDAAEFVADLRQACVTPHVAQKTRYSAIDGRTTRHEGYALSIRNRKRIEEAFGWAKTVGGMAQTVYRGLERVRSRFILTMAANNLARLPRLLGA